MTLESALAHHMPAGSHAGCTLAALSLDHPDYLIRLAEGRVPEECPPGSRIREAVRVVADAILANWEADVLAGRTVGPDEFAAADHANDGVFGTAGTEQIRRSHARRGRHYEENRDEVNPMALFGGTFK